MGRTIYLTIASANYLPQIEALRSSLLRHNPRADFRCVLCEHPAVVRRIAADTGLRFMAPDEIGCPEWFQMAFSYSVMEYNTAIKPFVMRKLAREADAVVYFDPDIVIYNELSELERMLENYDCVLTPHLLNPLEEDGHEPDILTINRVGQFNLGFLAVRSEPQIDTMLAWWGNRCRRDCVHDLPNGLFVDQSWANMFASFAHRPKILRSSAYNMAYWNAHERKLWREGGRWMCDDGFLTFFHFSGLSNDIRRISRYQTRLSAEPGSALYEILSEYRGSLDSSALVPYRDLPYSFAAYADGPPISMEARRRFRALSDAERLSIANPFVERMFMDRLVSVSLGYSSPPPEPGNPNALRYRVVDRLNSIVKTRLPGLHSAAKSLAPIVGGAARRLNGVGGTSS